MFRIRARIRCRDCRLSLRERTSLSRSERRQLFSRESLVAAEPLYFFLRTRTRIGGGYRLIIIVAHKLVRPAFAIGPIGLVDRHFGMKTVNALPMPAVLRENAIEFAFAVKPWLSNSTTQTDVRSPTASVKPTDRSRLFPSVPRAGSSESPLVRSHRGGS